MNIQQEHPIISQLTSLFNTKGIVYHNTLVDVNI